MTLRICLAAIAMSISIAALPAAASAQANLPVEVRADLLQNRIIAHLESGELTEAKEALAEYRKLDIQMPITLILVDAKIAANLGEHGRAKSALEEYLGRAGRTATGYQEALTLYADAEKRAKDQKHAEFLQALYDVSLARAAITDDLDEAYRLLARDKDGRIAATLGARKFCRKITETRQVDANAPSTIEYDYNAMGLMTRRGDARFEYVLSESLNGWIWKKKSIYPRSERAEEFNYFKGTGWIGSYIFTDSRGSSKWTYRNFFDRKDRYIQSYQTKLNPSGRKTKQIVSETFDVNTGRLILTRISDASGARTDMTEYSYDSEGRMTRLTRTKNGMRQSPETFEYAGGTKPIKRISRPNGSKSGKTITNYQYDNDGCLVQAIEVSTNPDGTQSRIKTDYEVGVFRIVENTLPSES